MTEATSAPKTKTESSRDPGAATLQGKTGADAAPATRSRTSIADGVVEKIAGMAAREVPGVHALGGGFARTMGAVRDMVPGGRAGVTRGVKVEVGEIQTAIDLALVVEYGVAIADLAADHRHPVPAGRGQQHHRPPVTHRTGAAPARDLLQLLPLLVGQSAHTDRIGHRASNGRIGCHRTSNRHNHRPGDLCGHSTSSGSATSARSSSRRRIKPIRRRPNQQA